MSLSETSYSESEIFRSAGETEYMSSALCAIRVALYIIPFLHVLVVTDLKVSFETSLFSSSIRQYGTDTREYKDLLICQFCMSNVVCSCDGKGPIHGVNIEL
jgi:hypothetical protein